MLLTTGAAALVAAPAGTQVLVMGTMGLGLAAGVCAPTCVALIADHVSPADRGIAMGLFEAACGASFLVSGLAGGYSADAFGAGAPYLIVAALAIGWVVVLARGLTPPGGSRFG